MKALLWFHSNTAGVPKSGEFKSIQPLEAAAMLTTIDLEPLVEVWEVFKLNGWAFQSLKKNKRLAQRFNTIGLLEESSESQVTLKRFEDQVLNEFYEFGYAPKVDILLAGSAMSHFTKPLVTAKFPRLDEFLSTSTYGLTEHHTIVRTMAGRDLVNPNISMKPKEIIRSRERIKRDLEEAKEYQKFYRSLAEKEIMV